MSKFLIQNKIYFLILCFFSIFVVFLSFYKNDIDSLYSFFLSLSFVIVILLFIYYFTINKLIFYFPINILFNIYLLISFLYFIFHYDYILFNTYPALFNELDTIVFQNLFNNAIILLITTIFFLILLSFLIVNFLKKINYFPNLNEIQLIRFNFYLLIIKLIFLF